MVGAALVALVLAGPMLGKSQGLESGPRISDPQDVNPMSPLFEFAPASGLGMTTACAGTNPSDVIKQAVGTTLTFTRASSATCLKTTGTAPQAIANGDMVTLTNNQPRVMAGTDGTSVRGLLVESGRTNSLLRSQELNNAAWSTESSGVVVPTITADQAVAPDGTTTADRMQIPATSGGNYSAIFQSPAALGVTSAFIFLRGNATSGSTDLCQWNGAGHTCVTCNFVSTSWTLCKNENVNGGAASVYTIGNASGLNGGIARAANDVFAWGGQWEVGTFCSSYIATAGAATPRSEDLPLFTVAFAAPTTWSMAATWIAPSNIVPDPFAMEVNVSAAAANNRYDLYIPTSNHYEALIVVGGASFTTNVVGITPTLAGAVNRLTNFYDGALQSGCANASCASTAQVYTPFAPTQIVVGNFTVGGDAANGVVKQLCYNPTSTGCR
jgi:hypothetical protein